jgi:hypothetical protein
VEIEVDDRSEVEIDAERGQFSGLWSGVSPDGGSPLVGIGIVGHQLGQGGEFRERRRKPGHGATLLIGRNPERRQALAAADVLQGVDVAPDLSGVLSSHVSRGEKDAGDRAPVNERVQLLGIAVADDDMPSDHFELLRVGGKHLAAKPMKPCFQANGRQQKQYCRAQRYAVQGAKEIIV